MLSAWVPEIMTTTPHQYGVRSFGNDESLVANLCGLDNLGNNCYMNSLIQSLFLCGPFRRNILQYCRKVEEVYSNNQEGSEHSSTSDLTSSSLIPAAVEKFTTNIYFKLGRVFSFLFGPTLFPPQMSSRTTFQPNFGTRFLQRLADRMHNTMCQN